MLDQYKNLFVTELTRLNGFNIVLTGGPSVGKSTMAEWLASIGAILRPEMASILIQAANKYLRENGHGPASQDTVVVAKFKELGLFHPMVDNAAFQTELMQRQEEQEHGYVHRTVREFVCFDRANPDNYPYCDHYGVPYPKGFETLTPPPAMRYDLCLLLQSFDRYVDNGVRVEGTDAGVEFAKIIGPLLGAEYRKHGVPVIEVPAFSNAVAEISIQQRKDFIWKQICDYAEQKMAKLAA